MPTAAVPRAPTARAPLTLEAVGIVLECTAPLEYLHSLGGIRDPLDVHAQPEAIEQLGADLAFFGIHRAHEHESRGMLEADALTFDDVHTHRRRVEQRVNDVIIEEVHFVDVQDAAVGIGQKPRLEAPLAVLERMFEIDRTHDPVFGGRNRQIHERGAARRLGERAGREPFTTFVAQIGTGVRVTTEAASLDDFDRRQHPAQPAYSRGLGRPFLTADQDTADPRIDGVDEQRCLEGRLSDYR